MTRENEDGEFHNKTSQTGPICIIWSNYWIIEKCARLVNSYRQIHMGGCAVEWQLQGRVLIVRSVETAGPRGRDGCVFLPKVPVGLEDLPQVCSQAAAVVHHSSQLLYLNRTATEDMFHRLNQSYFPTTWCANFRQYPATTNLWYVYIWKEQGNIITSSKNHKHNFSNGWRN